MRLRRRYRRPWWKLMLAFLIPVALPIYVTSYLIEASTRREYEAIAKLGVPLHETGRSYPNVAPEDNAALFYQKAAKLLFNKGPECSAYQDLQRFDPLKALNTYQCKGQVIHGSGAMDDIIALIKDYDNLDSADHALTALADMNALEPVLALARDGSAKPLCRFSGPDHLDADIFSYNRWVFFDMNIVPCCSALQMSAWVHARSGDSATAANDILCAARIARQFDESRFQYKPLQYQDTVIPNFLRRCYLLAKAHPDDRILLAGIAKALDEVPVPVTAASLVKGTFPKYRKEYDTALADPELYLTMNVSDYSFGFDPLQSLKMKLAVRQTVGAWRKAFEGMAGDPNDVRRIGSTLTTAEIDLNSTWPADEMLVSRLTEPQNLMRGIPEALLEPRLLSAATRILIYRAEHGAFPNRIDEVKGMAADPYAIRPLRYRRTEKGFVVYSVGFDRTDGGGDFRIYGQEHNPRPVTRANDVGIDYVR